MLSCSLEFEYSTGCAGALGDLPVFRQEFYWCVNQRADTEAGPPDLSW